MAIKDKIEWVGGKRFIRRPRYVRRHDREPEDAVTATAPVDGLEVESKTLDKRSSTTAAAVVAKRFVDLVKDGEKPGKAAQRAGTTLKAIMASDEVRLNVKTLIEAYHLPAAIRKELVRASENKLLLENIDSADPAAQKLALDAAKAISQDPDVGLNAPPAPAVQIDLGDLAGLLAQIAVPPPVIDVTPAVRELPAPVEAPSV